MLFFLSILTKYFLLELNKDYMYRHIGNQNEFDCSKVSLEILELSLLGELHFVLKVIHDLYVLIVLVSDKHKLQFSEKT